MLIVLVVLHSSQAPAHLISFSTHQFTSGLNPTDGSPASLQREITSFNPLFSADHVMQG
jgi:hypothetical protein